MSGMTPERLDEIHLRANLQCGLDGEDADDLLNEVRRLRTGIEALTEWWQRIPGDGGYEVACKDHARQALALLNPTEGETDDR